MGPLRGESTGDGWLPSQSASNTQNNSLTWGHNEAEWYYRVLCDRGLIITQRRVRLLPQKQKYCLLTASHTSECSYKRDAHESDEPLIIDIAFNPFRTGVRGDLKWNGPSLDNSLVLFAWPMNSTTANLSIRPKGNGIRNIEIRYDSRVLFWKYILADYISRGHTKSVPIFCPK